MQGFTRRTISLAISLIFAFSMLGAESPPTSLAIIKAAAEKGDAIAQDKLAEIYAARGDAAQARIWHRKSAEQGLLHAQSQLGHSLLSSYDSSPKTEVAKHLNEEALQWLNLAAIQGDHRAQADLARVHLAGKLVELDLIEAYKWGALASSEPYNPLFIDVTRSAGLAVRDSATLKMTQDQIAEARKRVAAFVPHKPTKSEIPDPYWVKQIKLNGISGKPDRRLALINGKTLQRGEETKLKLGEQTVVVRCLEIRESSVLVTIQGIEGTRELSLARHN